jgi:CheY-like chemotaxis protein
MTETNDRRTVLVVEDTPEDRLFLKAVLTHSGYTVVEAQDGEAGVTLAREVKPDLVVMDIQLPGIDGWEAMRRIRADPSTAAIPILGLTIHSFDPSRGGEEAFDGYMKKPILPKMLADHVKALLAGAAQGDEP